MGEWRRSTNTFLTSLLGREEWLALCPAALFQGKVPIALWVGGWVNSRLQCNGLMVQSSNP